MAKYFVASYSGGKDGALSVYKAVQRGMVLAGFITTFNTEQNRSWFHGVPEAVLADAAAQGADVCNENVEYHTFVSGGPIFTRPVNFKFGEKINVEHRVILPVLGV